MAYPENDKRRRMPPPPDVPSPPVVEPPTKVPEKPVVPEKPDVPPPPQIPPPPEVPEPIGRLPIAHNISSRLQSWVGFNNNLCIWKRIGEAVEHICPSPRGDRIGEAVEQVISGIAGWRDIRIRECNIP